jgi:hypothetical protein
MDTNKMKKIQKIGVACWVAVTLALIGGICYADDSAIWTTVNVSGSLTDNLSLEVEEQFRFADVSGPSLARQHTDLSLGWSVGDFLTAVGGYRNTSYGEHRLYVGADLSLFSAGAFDFGNSTRLELRDWDTLRGRTALSVTTSVAGLAPYVSDEVFVDQSGVTGNRATLGVEKSVNDTLGVNAYYLLDTTLGDSTSHTHVMGVGLNVSL